MVGGWVSVCGGYPFDEFFWVMQWLAAMICWDCEWQ